MFKRKEKCNRKENIEFSEKKKFFFIKFRNATWLSGEKAFLLSLEQKRSYKSGTQMYICMYTCKVVVFKENILFAYLTFPHKVNTFCHSNAPGIV